jgi:SulP family sulfate permease
MDYRGLKHIRQWPNAEVIVMLLVLGLTVFIGLIEAVLIGLVLASVLFMKSVADVVDHRTQSAPLRQFSREMPWVDEGDIIDRMGDKVYIKHLDGPLFFGFASRFQEMITALPEVKVVIMRMDKVPYVDQSGLYAMEDAVMDLQASGIKVVFTDLHGQPLEMFELFNLIPGLVESDLNFHDFQECSKWLEGYLRNNHLDEQKTEGSNILS